MKTRLQTSLAAGATALAFASALPAQDVRVRFAAPDRAHQEALQEYRHIWEVDGARILRTLERVSGLSFPVHQISVELIDGPSWAGGERIGMRWSYSTDTKRGTLVHELGHLLIGNRIPEVDGEPIAEHHEVLFLFLYDVWVELWGEEFADGQVEVESARRGGVDYAGLWRNALSLSRDDRMSDLRGIMAGRP